MGVLRTLTDEYFGSSIREENKIDISGLDVKIVSFTDKNNVFHKYGYRVKDNSYGMGYTLRTLIKMIIEKRGNECSLNDIDVSNITQMKCHNIGVFERSSFNGDISGWDVSNVIDMSSMFWSSKFTGKNGIFRLENGNKVENMWSMFYKSEFEADINDWEVRKDCNIASMFFNTPLEQNDNLPTWYLDRQ